MKRPGNFGQLLTQAVKMIAALEQKSIRQVHVELELALGRQGTGTTIEYWRKGKCPSDEDMERLAKEIVKHGGFRGKKNLEHFLLSCGYPLAEELCNELYPQEYVDLHNKSQPVTEQFVGRSETITRLLETLQNPDRNWIVGIDGLGGIGKSAIARQLAIHCGAGSFFDGVVNIDIAGAVTGGSLIHTWEDAVSVIGQNLKETGDRGARYPTRITPAQFPALLRERRYLLILDNLHVIGQSIHEIIKGLMEILHYSKALLTSRSRLDEISSIHLLGLERSHSEELIYQLAEQKLPDSRIFSGSDLELIIRHTGGCPLAIKLVVGQLQPHPLETVLSHLEHVRPLRPDGEEDEYLNFYRHLYQSSWQSLGPSSRDLLIAMGIFPPDVGGTLEAIGKISDLKDSDLSNCIEELWRRSLLEISESIHIQERRYYLHTLTTNFVRSDIAHETE